MAFYNLLVENLILPLSDVALKRSIYKHVAFLNKSQWWTRDQLVEYQGHRLRNIVSHAYHNVPFYRKLYSDAGIHPEDIREATDVRKLPIVSKEMLRSHFPIDVVTAGLSDRDVIKHSSSGSTGKPFTYLVSKHAYSFNIACNVRGWNWMGFRLGDRFLKISQYNRPWQKRLQDLSLRMRYVSSADLSPASLARLVDLLRSYKPHIIRCYPEPLSFLARYMAEHKIDDIRPHAITTTGSMLLPAVRRVVEEQFHCRIFDSYRCEGGANAFETETHESYLSSMEYGITEILDAHFNEVPDGEQGIHVATDLQNYAMPFIRYDSQDILTKGTSNSACGRQHLTIGKIDGRTSDILVTPRGQLLIVLHFADYFDKFLSIEQFQVIQQTKDSINIKLVVNEQFNEETAQKIRDYWHRYTKGTMRYSLEIVDHIESGVTGKRRLLLRSSSVPLPQSS